MIKKDQRTDASGKIKTQIRVVESYRPGTGMNPKQRTIKDFGCLEDQVDPIAFMKEVEEFNKTYKEQNAPLRIEAAGTEQMYGENNRKYNYGYKYLEAVYDILSIDGYINEHMKAIQFKGGYSPAEIFKFLVLHRILTPDSKRATFQIKEGFYGKDMAFNLNEIQCRQL